MRLACLSRNCADHAIHRTRRLVARIDAAVAAMNELFNALLDISKLDAGVLTPDVDRVSRAAPAQADGNNVRGAAREKGLRLRVIAERRLGPQRSHPSRADAAQSRLQRCALHGARKGLVGCRRRGEQLSIEVRDTGIGIPEDQQRDVFGEFYRLGGLRGDRSSGLGLGLAIVDRLCNLLDHPLELVSHVGKGSRFAVSVPLTPRLEETTTPIALADIVDPVRGKLVVIIDDDPLVLQGMGGVLRDLGVQSCRRRIGQAALVHLPTRPNCPT